VRNQLDGTVEVEASGDDAVVDALVAWLRQGPSMARVTGIDVVDLPVTTKTPGFTVR
jgi:acylphosphatase